MEASICADKKIVLSFSVAISNALIEEERPMIKGTNVEGKTTRSLKGIIGIFLMISDWSLIFCIIHLQLFLSPINHDQKKNS